jgi:poly(A) polymerase
MQWMRDVGLLQLVLPELDATVAFSQEGGRRHKDVWDHTKTVVRQAVPRPEVRWAAILHDIGKVPTRRFTPEGRVTFHGHAEVGVRMFRRGPSKRIRFPEPVRARVEELIRYHLRPGQYEKSWTDSAVRRFDRDMGDCLRDLLDLSRADITSKRPGKRKACLREISLLAERIEALRELDAQPKALPAGLGNHLMQSLSLPPGKHLADLRDRLEELCADLEIESGRDSEYYVAVVTERGLLADLEIRPPKGLRHQAAAKGG